MMHNKKWIGSVILAVTLALVGVATISLRLNANERALDFEREHFDLGEQPQGAVVPCDIVFQNVSPHPIRIEGVEAGCSCASTRFPEEDIPPGGKGVISLQISIDQAGTFYLYPQVMLVGNPEPFKVVAHFRGIQVLTPEPPVVHVPEFTNESIEQITLRWAVNSEGLPFALGRWHVSTPADFLWLGQPEVTSDGDQTYVVVPATVAGVTAPEGLFRTKATLRNDARLELESDCLVVGMTEEQALVFDPPTVLLGRVVPSSGKLSRSVQVRLRSRGLFQLGEVATADPALTVQHAESDPSSHRLFLDIDVGRLSAGRPWKADVAVTTVDGKRGHFGVHAFVQRNIERE